jgi:hypothetical protein
MYHFLQLSFFFAVCTYYIFHSIAFTIYNLCFSLYHSTSCVYSLHCLIAPLEHHLQFRHSALELFSAQQGLFHNLPLKNVLQCVVHFFLELPEPFLHGDITLLGKFLGLATRRFIDNLGLPSHLPTFSDETPSSSKPEFASSLSVSTFQFRVFFLNALL